MADDFKIGNKLSPHEKDEEFNWRKAELNDEDIVYVIYPSSSYDLVLKQRITSELGFKWCLTHWERKQPFTKQELDDLLMDGIVVEKR